MRGDRGVDQYVECALLDLQVWAGATVAPVDAIRAALAKGVIPLVDGQREGLGHIVPAVVIVLPLVAQGLVVKVAGERVLQHHRRVDGHAGGKPGPGGKQWINEVGRVSNEDPAL